MIIFTDGKSIDISLIERLAECIAKYKPSEIVIREKHLNDVEYAYLVDKITQLSEDKNIKLWVNGRPEIALLKHLPLHIGYTCFIKLKDMKKYGEISVAVHSLEEALIAEKLGASRIVFGHIFDTECKAGVPARGLELLSEICTRTNIPVVAIGGINADNKSSVLKCGTSDICIMSSAMMLTY